MARKVKVPLKIKDIKIMTIEDLREHFDYNSVLEYYQNGKLEAWLRDKYYTDEADRIGNLRPSSEGLMKEICEILGVEYSESEAPIVSMSSVAKKNNNYERLKQYTADDEILKNVDKVAFSQEELLELLDNGAKEIYLCGDEFVIPGDIANIKYIGVNKPHVSIHGEMILEGIAVKNVKCDISGYMENMSNFKSVFQNNPELGFSLLNENIEHLKECPRYLRGIAWCYEQGFGIEKNDGCAYKYYREFAELDDAEGSYYLARYYEDKNNYNEAYEWFKKSGTKGFMWADGRLADFYYEGKVVNRDCNKAVTLWKKAILKGDTYAMYKLAGCYINGKGVMVNKHRGIELYQKAYENGNYHAISGLIYHAPELIKINEALSYVLGGKDNLYDEIVLLENYGIMLIKVKNITKIHYNALLKVAEYYLVDCNNITFFGNDDNAEKIKVNEDVIIMLDGLLFLDSGSINALESEFTVDKYDMLDTQDYLEVFVDILKELKMEYGVIGFCKTFKKIDIDLIKGKRKIENYLERLNVRLSPKS